jgi:hypothetical protein
MCPRIPMPVIGTAFLVMALVFTNCPNKRVTSRKGESPMTAKSIEEVLRLHTKGMMSIPGVVGMAQGLCNDKPCIRIYVARKTPELERQIPTTLDGYPVTIEETGNIHAFPKNEGGH